MEEYNFIKLNTSLDIGCEYLTYNVAYFLGGICVGDMIEMNNTIYWISLVRHNPNMITEQQLESHINKVKILAEPLNKSRYIYTNDYFKSREIKLRSSYNGALIFSAGKKGFLTLFKKEEVETTDDYINNTYTIDDYIEDIKIPLLQSNMNVLRSFIIGIFDSKGSYDGRNYIAVDINNESVANLIIEVLKKLNIHVNYNNTFEARKRDSEFSRPRAAQIRVIWDTYLNEFGYISSQRLEHIKLKLEEKGREYIEVENVEVPLRGLRQIKIL